MERLWLHCSSVVYRFASMLRLLGGLTVALFSLLAHAQGDAQWTMAAQNFAGHRFSALDEVTAANVAQLQVAFTFDTGVPKGQESISLVADNTMFIVGPFPNVLFALDLTKPGAPLKWK